MISYLLWAFALQCLAILYWGLRERERMIQFPFLAAAVFLGWMLPQLVGLSNHPFLPHGGLEKTIFMAILCNGAAWWGYTSNKRPAKLFWWRFDRRRLVWGSAALSLMGAFFFYQVSQLAAEATAKYGGAWTGIITIYIFFARLLSCGMALALILYLKKPGWSVLSILLFDLMFYLDRIIIKGRRAAMVELGLMLLMAVWFQRRWMPPRWAMVSAMIVGALVINSIGDYRSTMMGDDRTTWSGAGIREILEIDYVGNLQRLASGKDGNHDLENAVMNIEATSRTLGFDFGLSHWNGFVNSYVPGQWVGHDVKRSLMIHFDNAASSLFGHRPYTGSTPTGLSDAFLSFWYLGAVKFFLIGLILSRWYKAAVRGNIVAQMVLMLVVTLSLHAITHSTHHFFTVFVPLAVFLLPMLTMARVTTPKQRAIHGRVLSNSKPKTLDQPVLHASLQGSHLHKKVEVGCR